MFKQCITLGAFAGLATLAIGQFATTTLWSTGGNFRFFNPSWSADGAKIYTLPGAQSWSRANGQYLAFQSSEIYAIAHSSERAVGATDETTRRLFLDDLRTGARLWSAVLPASVRSTRAIAIDSAASQVAVAGESQLAIFEGSSGALLMTIPVSSLLQIAYNSTGSMLACASSSQLTVIDARTGSVLGSWPLSGTTFVYPLAWSPDGSILMVSRNNFCAAHVPLTGQILHAFTSDPRPTSFAFSPDGSQLSTGDVVGNWTLRRTNDWTVRYVEAVSGISQTAFSPSGNEVAVASSGGLLQVRDSQTGSLILSLSSRGTAPKRTWQATHAGPIVSVVDLSSPQDGGFEVRDRNTGHRLDLQINGLQSSVAAVSMDGRSLVSLVETGFGLDVAVVNLATGAVLLRWPSGFVNSAELRISPDGRMVAVSAQQTTRVFQIETGELMATLSSLGLWDWGGDSETVVGVQGSNIVRVRTADNSVVWSRPRENMFGGQISPNGNLISLRSLDGRIGYLATLTGEMTTFSSNSQAVIDLFGWKSDSSSFLFSTTGSNILEADLPRTEVRAIYSSARPAVVQAEYNQAGSMVHIVHRDGNRTAVAIGRASNR